MTFPGFVQSPLLRSVPGVYHAFPGVDPVPGRSVDQRLAREFLVSPASIGTLRQVHSAVVLAMEEGDAGRCEAGRREGDGLYTAARGSGVGVRTADCVPLLLVDPDIPVAAAIHVGWRGLAAGMVGEAVRVLVSRFGEAVRDRLLAAVGPSAKGCCYEVGDEVEERLRPLPGAARHLRRGGGPGRWMADMQGLAVESLAACGLGAGNVEATGPCTVCSPRFHSFRREKALTGRQLSFIYIV